MAVDYRYERGWVGNWRGLKVFILEQDEYLQNRYNLNDDVVYVIADDGMCMVNKGYIIGHLNRNGNVSECDRTRYRPVQQKPQEEEEKEEEVTVSTSGEGEAIELTTTIPKGYFDGFAREVTEFFKNLQDPKIGEE